MQENKLQIRAKILSAIANLQQNFDNRNVITQTIQELSAITDKDSILEILLKELLKENNDSRDCIIKFILSELIEIEGLEKKLYEMLANPQISDYNKTKIVSLLRENGKHVNYEQYTVFFENPDEIIDSDTEKLLENAMINPESQIDFLDFIKALPQQEKEMLLTSLSIDYDGDGLANVLNPIVLSEPYSEISQLAIKFLGESKSKLAYPTLTKLESIIEDKDVKANLQKSINLLKLCGIREDITTVFYEKLLCNSPVYSCCMSFPDGHGNSGIIFSRKNTAGFIQMFALVINDSNGIIDCFGFNEITENELARILEKFFINNKVVDIPPTAAKYFMEKAEELTRKKYKEVSYEYIAWKSLTYDIPYTNLEVEYGIEKIKLDNNLLEKIYETNYLDKWFITANDNEAFDELTNNLMNKQDLNLEDIEQQMAMLKSQIFNAKQLATLDNRLSIGAYLLKENLEEFNASLLLALKRMSEVKSRFLDDCLKRSIYEFYLLQKDKYENTKSMTSIFTKKANNENKNININLVKNIISQIEQKWV